MRIGIDISWMQGPPSGTATYVAGLVEALVRLDTPHEFVLFSRSHRRDGMRDDEALPGVGLPRVSHVPVDAPLTNLRQQATLPLAIRRARLDLYHSPAYFLPVALPLLWRGPTVLGVFDLNFLRLGENWQPGRRAQYVSLTLQVPLAARQATRILTLSRASARDIARLLHLPPHKIAVIPAAPRDLFHQAPDPASVEQARERHGPFFLGVGVLAPQKNVARIIEAFARADDGATRLVLAGRLAGDYAERVLRPLARRLGVAARVVFAGAVDDETLRALYHAAVALVYPSLGEGFGLPIVEAMACGCPVVTSNISSMPDVAGDAALLVDPRDVAALCAALARIRDDSSLRMDLARRGQDRADLFTWDAVAHRTLDLYTMAGSD